MKIALIADPEIAVPPLLYGGIERIIDMIIDQFVAEGHEVFLFASADSTAKAKLFPLPAPTCTKKKDILLNTWYINKTIFSNKFDIIHCFGRLLYLLPQLPLSIPKLMSYQREPTVSQIKRVMSLSKKGTMAFTGCSSYISDQISPVAPSFSIYNGVELDKYRFAKSVSTDAPLVFLGRIEPTKGTHVAIEVAKRSHRKLVIAGNIPEAFQTYFDEEIKPELNNQIVYIGPVNDEQKSELLSHASAFLMPILWNEPFGIVMAEAMACGTPVIGFNRGSVPEVVINGVNGFSCNTVDEMVELVKELNRIDRQSVKDDTEKRFSAKVIAKNYLNLYQKMINKLI